MAIRFGPLDIPGTHESPQRVPPRLMVKRTDFSGVRGESEILQMSKGRLIVIPIWIHGKWQTSDGLMEFLDTLDDQVGTHGDLVITNTSDSPGVPDTFKYCTFEGFTRASDSQAGPLPDNIGHLDGVTPSWWIRGQLAFYQLEASG